MSLLWFFVNCGFFLWQPTVNVFQHRKRCSYSSRGLRYIYIYRTRGWRGWSRASSGSSSRGPPPTSPVPRPAGCASVKNSTLCIQSRTWPPSTNGQSSSPPASTKRSSFYSTHFHFLSFFPYWYRNPEYFGSLTFVQYLCLSDECSSCCTKPLVIKLRSGR